MFLRKIEDFTCEHCGFAVVGNGYTNHCSKCLWSKHVDHEPGDRGNECGGLMKPISLVKKKTEYKINHQCQKCGQEKLNKVSPDDNIDILLNNTTQI